MTQAHVECICSESFFPAKIQKHQGNKVKMSDDEREEQPDWIVGDLYGDDDE
jgi:hypothetical protein